MENFLLYIDFFKMGLDMEIIQYNAFPISVFLAPKDISVYQILPTLFMPDVN